MPWKECHVMDERLRFVARLLEGETMVALCEEFGISRKTGHKILPAVPADRRARADRSQPAAASPRESAADGRREDDRQDQAGVSQLGRPQDPGAAPAALARGPLSRHQHGACGARPPRARDPPVAPIRRRLTGTPLSWPAAPNRLWCADYKGEFLLGNRRYCYPLTITDFASRYLLACEALSTTKERYAFTVFERAFQEYGLPEAIRTDNGVPFASAHALYGLSKLAVWWLRLGIGLERIAPGHPEQNGRHERLHLTLKTEATRPPSHECPPAAGPLRYLRPPVQSRAAASGARDGDAGQSLPALGARLSGPGGTRVSAARLDAP